VSVIDLSRLEEVVEQIHDGDGRRRRHQEHAFCVQQQRRCNERFDTRIAPPTEDSDVEGFELSTIWDQENAEIIAELKDMYFGDGTTNDSADIIDLSDNPEDSEDSCELECCMTKFTDLEAHDRFFDRELGPLPSFA
jgi:hypothetical protein